MDWVTTTTILDGLRDHQNAAAWGSFVERFRAPIIRFARRLGVAGPAAEDVAQETLLAFVQAYRDGEYDRSKGRLSRWLFGIAYRRALRERDQQKRSDAMERIDETGADRSAAWELLVDEEAATTLWDAEWEVFVLRACVERVRAEFEPTTIAAFEALARREAPVAQVAARLGMAVKTAYNAKHRVLKRIREVRQEIERLEAPRAGPLRS